MTRLSANDQARLAITKAKVALNVTKAQEQAWQAYEDAATALLGTSAESARASTLSGRIEEQQAPLRSRLAAFDRLSAAAKNLYAVLDDEQKATADRLLPPTVPGAFSAAPASEGSKTSALDRSGPAF